jgi:histidinol-phosphate/aromatic aminotransferase/cobyric acid decarboxylase-like protein
MIWAFLLISSFSRNRKFALTCVSILMLRVTVGSDEQNQQFISIVEAFYH